MQPRTVRSFTIRTAFRTLAALVVALLVPIAFGYTPGSGTIYSDNFNGTLDADWELGNNVSDSPWTQIADGADKSFYADGKGSVPSSPTRHWGRHFVHPVSATSFSVAFEYRGELGPNYYFDIVVKQRAPQLKQYKFRIDGSGIASLWRSENGAMVQKVASSSGLIPVNTKRWIRVGIEPNAGGQLVGARIWSGSATSEPASGWTISFVDNTNAVQRVHAVELVADGPKNIETWIDDLDCYGDGSIGVASTVTEIYMVEMSHLDIGFTLPEDDIENFEKSSLDQVLQNLAADPDYKWTIESAWQLDRWWERSTQAERDNMIYWLGTGRLRLLAGYANLHTTAAGQEELTRNLYYASRFTREHNLPPLRAWITDDVPGSSFAIPEILARSGIDYFVGGMNTPFGGTVKFPNQGTRPFWWQGPDGSKVLSWTTFDSYAEAFNYGFSFFDTTADAWRNMGRELPKLEEAGYPYPELMLFRAFDNHYQGLFVRDRVNQWNATYSTPHIRLATINEFMDMMKAKYGAASFPTYSGDYGPAWSASHQTTPNTTRWVRSSHREGRSAEAMLAVGAALGNGSVPQSDVDFMYRRQLEIDEHSGAGSWPTYWNPEQMSRNNQIFVGIARDAFNKANDLAALGNSRMVANVPAVGDALVVVNPLLRARDGWVRATLPGSIYQNPFRIVDRATGLELPYQKFDASSEVLFRATGVPSLGYKLFDIAPGAPTATPTGLLSLSGNTLENDAYSMTIDSSDGSVSSLVRKATGKQLIDLASTYRFNRLAANISNEINASNPPVAQGTGAVTVTPLSSGPMVAELKVTRGASPLVQTIYRLYRGEDRVEIENTIDRTKAPYVNNATGTRAYFVTLPFDVHNFNLRTESTTRFLDPKGDAFQRNDSFDWHNIEHTLTFWDAGQGIVYAVDNTESHFFEKLKALGGPTIATGTGMLLPRLYDRSDEYQYADGSYGQMVYEPGTDDILTFRHEIRGVDPGFDPAAVSRFGFESLNNLKATLIAARPGSLPGDRGSFLTIDDPNVLPYTFKAADDGDGYILRVTELSGSARTVTVDSALLAIADAKRAAQDEQGGTPLTVSSGRITLPLAAYETATVRLHATLRPTTISLTVTKDAAHGTVKLNWIGGGPSTTLRRSTDPQFSSSNTLQSGPGNSFDDPVLNDGQSYFYLVD